MCGGKGLFMTTEITVTDILRMLRRRWLPICLITAAAAVIAFCLFCVYPVLTTPEAFTGDCLLDVTVVSGSDEQDEKNADGKTDKKDGKDEKAANSTDKQDKTDKNNSKDNKDGKKEPIVLPKENELAAAYLERLSTVRVRAAIGESSGLGLAPAELAAKSAVALCEDGLTLRLTASGSREECVAIIDSYLAAAQGITDGVFRHGHIEQLESAVYTDVTPKPDWARKTVLATVGVLLAVCAAFFAVELARPVVYAADNAAAIIGEDCDASMLCPVALGKGDCARTAAKLRILLGERENRCAVVTGVSEDESSALLVCELAEYYARAGVRVLVADTAAPGKGLLSRLSSKPTKAAAGQTIHLDGIDYAALGSEAADPAKTVERLAASGTPAKLTADYDVVLLAVGSVCASPDAIRLAGGVGGVLLTAVRCVTARADLLHAVQDLRLAKADLLGLALCDMPAGRIIGQSDANR